MKEVKSLKVALETVTPLFLAGAEPRGAPELRAPSFRGVLRYWLRAALGGVLGDDDKGLASLREAESHIFGSTDEKGGASVITIRVSGSLLKPESYMRGKATWVNKQGKRIPQPTGRDYLYWSIPGFRGEPDRQYYPKGSKIFLELRVRPGVLDNTEAIKKVVAALWLMIHLGGIGSRSRRTAGSLSVIHPNQANGFNFLLHSTTPKAIAQELGKGLNSVRQIFQQAYGSRMPSISPEFDVLHPHTCKVWVLGTWPSSDAAVETIGAAMRDFRTYREPDHTQVARWLTGSNIKTIERSVFGLPLQFRYANRGPQAIVQGRTKPRKSAIDRRSSPLWLKVSKTEADSYVGVATLFLSRFLPSGEKLHEQRERAPAIDPPADYSLIEHFIAEKFCAEEVQYV